MVEIKSKEIKIVAISEIKKKSKNRNKHPKDQIEMLVKHYQYQGFRNPLIVSNQSGEVVCGNGRLEAAILAGIKELPVIYQDFETPEQEYAYHVADNGLSLWAELDLSGINVDLADLGPDLDIDMLGIKDFEIEPADKYQDKDADEVPEEVEPIAKLGQIYKLGEHRLMCGDSTSEDDVAKLMNGEKADMVFTDPPYGENHAASEMVSASERIKGKSIVSSVKKIKNDENIDFLKNVSLATINHLKTDFAAFVFFKWNKWEKIKEYFSEFGEPKTVCVWDRNQQGASTFRINPVHEFCFYWGTLGDKKEKGNLRNVWRCQKERENKELHPTVKPQEIIEMPIRMCCDIGGIVLDLFGGSGSTLIACEKANRKCFMMELDPHYVDVIIARWEKFTGKKAELINE